MCMKSANIRLHTHCADISYAVFNSSASIVGFISSEDESLMHDQEAMSYSYVQFATQHNADAQS
jgi:hypothetical protein